MRVKIVFRCDVSIRRNLCLKMQKVEFSAQHVLGHQSTAKYSSIHTVPNNSFIIEH